MGDAHATYFEARASYKHDGPNFEGGKALHMGIALARLCYDMLIENGYKAKLALEKGALTSAVEAVMARSILRMSRKSFQKGTAISLMCRTVTSPRIRKPIRRRCASGKWKWRASPALRRRRIC